MSKEDTIPMIKLLRQKFLEERSSLFDSKHEFTELMSSVLNLDAYDFYSINFISPELQNIFPDEEYRLLYAKCRENIMCDNWINDGKRIFSTNETIVKLMDEARVLLPSEMVYKSYLEFITAKICVDYIANKN